MKLTTLTGLVASAATVLADSIPYIDIVGNKFFYSNNGSQFYIKGVAYQSRDIKGDQKFSDPLADADACKRDIPYLQQLSTNVIRVYAVNASLDHSECMNALNDAGIYVIADLSEPGLSINRAEPQWNVELYQRYTSVVDMFAEYSNVLGFFAGNEVINAANNTDSAPFVKAAIRDTKAYIKQKNYRNIPVGYSASDDAQVRVPEADYFACGDETVHADFYGVNMYEWCGDSNFETSGYKARTEEMKNLTTPIFFSEYGCNEVTPRKFTEVQALYGSNMTDVWSGGIVYEYFQEENDYGLVEIDNDSVSTREDFGYLSSQLANISPSSAHSSDITTASSSIDCPATGTTNWNAATELPPTPNSDVCACLDSDLSCVIDSDVDEEDYEAIFDYICGSMDCGAINANGTTGVYGAFIACSPKQKLNYVLDQYYSANGEDSSACDFRGSATLQDNVNTASSCAAYYSQAGSSGTGVISATATGAGSAAATSGRASATGSSSARATSSGRSSSSSASGSSSTTSNAAIPAPTGNMKLVAGVLGGAVAVVAGAL